jgi:O-antigen/teichoic acid export membrane protein
MHEHDSSELTRKEVRRRASAGIFVTASSGVAQLFVGFFGNLALARLLTPRDFGIVAIGSTVMLLGSALADGGLASGFIRTPAPPTRRELRTLCGIQLGLTAALAAVGIVIGLQFGIAGDVTALMLIGLPITAFVAPGKVVLMRQLLYTRIAVAEFASSLGFYVWSITAVAFGAGVWGMASGTVVKSVLLAVSMSALSPVGFTRPSLSRARELGEIMRFGLTFQAGWVIWLVREQLVNVLTGSIGGVRALGLWSLARRLLELPWVLLESVVRVTYPTMTHILASGENPKPTIERATRFSAIVMALVLSSFAGSSIGLVPTVFGQQWEESAWIIPPAALGLMFGAPISAGTAGYLFAVGRPGAVARMSLWSSVTWLVTTAALLPFVGVVGVGCGWIAYGATEAVMLSRATRRECGARVLERALAPVASGAAGGAVGTAIGLALGPNLLSGLAGGTVAALVTAALLLMFCHRDLFATIGALSGTVRDALRVRLSGAAPPSAAES